MFLKNVVSGDPVAQIDSKMRKMKNLAKNIWEQTLMLFVSVDYQL